MEKHERKLLSIQYWPLWFLVGLFRLTLFLPFSWQLKVGRGLGLLLYYFSARNRFIAKTNINLCFPGWPKQKRQALLKEAFKNVGMGAFETFNCWWGDLKTILPHTTFVGLEHIDNALKQGRGIMLLGGHFANIELAVRLVNAVRPCSLMYFEQKHPLLGYITEQGLKKHFLSPVRRDDLRGLLKHLHQNHIMCYTPDIDGGKKRSVFAPFFNVPAASLTAISRIAEKTQCPVMFTRTFRTSSKGHYLIEFLPPLENFPSGNDVLDATTINRTLEHIIEEYPEQYIWNYMRFKTRPEDEPRFYKHKV